jgi:cell division septation protein DedD
MRDANRIKEKFQLSLDGRQVASVVVGSLVILGGVFVLGLNVGKQLALRQAQAGPRPADPLAALDAPPPSADAGEPPRLSYHEALTRPADPPRPPPRPASVAKAPAAISPRPTPPATPTASPPSVPTAPSTPPSTPPPTASPTSPPAPKPTPTAIPKLTGTAIPKEEPRGAFAIQVGASQDLGEAHRVLERFKGHRGRIVSADIPGKGRWYRVRLGAFETRQDAERYLVDLSRETGVKGFVAPND